MAWFRWSALAAVLVGMRYFFSMLSSDARNSGDPRFALRWLGWWVLVWLVAYAGIYFFQLPAKGIRDSLWVRLDIPLPFGPKGILRILCFATPIDEDRTLVYFLRYRKLSGWKRAYWRFLYKTFWQKQHFKVIEQDRVILESQRGAQSRVAEHLANSDRGVTELRKLLREKIACRTAP